MIIIYKDILTNKYCIMTLECKLGWDYCRLHESTETYNKAFKCFVKPC